MHSTASRCPRSITNSSNTIAVTTPGTGNHFDDPGIRVPGYPGTRGCIGILTQESFSIPPHSGTRVGIPVTGHREKSDPDFDAGNGVESTRVYPGTRVPGCPGRNSSSRIAILRPRYPGTRGVPGLPGSPGSRYQGRSTRVLIVIPGYPGINTPDPVSKYPETQLGVSLSRNTVEPGKSSGARSFGVGRSSGLNLEKKLTRVPGYPKSVPGKLY
eukprot:2040734-Rhodomonas_salina.2